MGSPAYVTNYVNARQSPNYKLLESGVFIGLAIVAVIGLALLLTGTGSKPDKPELIHWGAGTLGVSVGLFIFWFIYTGYIISTYEDELKYDGNHRDEFDAGKTNVENHIANNSGEIPIPQYILPPKLA